MGQTRAFGERREVFGSVFVENEVGASGSRRSWRIGAEIGGGSSVLDCGFWASALLRWVRVFLQFLSLFLSYLTRVSFVWRVSVEVLRAFSATESWLAASSEVAWLGRGGARVVLRWWLDAAVLESWYYIPRFLVAAALVMRAVGLVDYSSFPSGVREKVEFRHLMLSVFVARGIVCVSKYVNADNVVVGSFFSVALVPTEFEFVGFWFDRGVSRLLARVRGVNDGGGLLKAQEVFKYTLFGLLCVVPGGWSVISRGLVVWLTTFVVAVYRAVELGAVRGSPVVVDGGLCDDGDDQVFYDADFGGCLNADEAVLARLRRVFPLPLASVPDDVLRISLENVRVGPSSGSHAEVRRYALLGDRLLGHALVQRAFDVGWDVGAISSALGSVVTNKNFAIYYDQEFRSFVCGEEKLSERRAGTFVEALVGMSVVFGDVQSDAVVEFLKVQLGFNVT